MRTQNFYTPKFRTESHWRVAPACYKWLHVCAYAINILCPSNKCYCKTAHMHRLVWADTGYTWDKHLYLTEWLIAHGRQFQKRTSLPVPMQNAQFVVGFLYMDAKEVFERSCESAHTYLTRPPISGNTKYGGIWRYTLKLEPASLDNYTCSFNE